MIAPTNIQLIGNELAVLWSNGDEGYITSPKLRAASPSAETSGERDILGNLHGGEFGKNYEGVEIVRWEQVGNYAIRFTFTDGHSSGLYGYELLHKLTTASID
ncbi:MAG: gamma-butyrobetaine hydroxylase-like domain-containing protein [Verrucomicrobiota bacterium]